MQYPNPAPNNIVLYTSLDQDLHLDNLKNLIVCTHVNFKLKNKNGKTVRQVIPWFGVEGIVISVKYEKEARGIREGSKKLFPSTIGVDYQSLTKNKYIKIAPRGLHQCAALSWENGIGTYYSMIDFICLMNDKWSSFRALPKRVQINTISWLLKNILIRKSRFQEISGIYMWNDDEFVKKIENLKTQKTYTRSRFDEKDLSPEINISELNSNVEIECVDLQTVEFLSMYTYDYPTEELYFNKIQTLLDMKPLSDGYNYVYVKVPKILNPYIILCRFNFKLDIDQKISLISLCMFLFSKGYSASFCNFPNMRKNLRVVYVEENEIESPKSITRINDNDVVEGKRAKNDKIVAHRFEIKQNGSFQQTSPSSTKSAEMVRNKLISDVYEFLSLNSE